MDPATPVLDALGGRLRDFETVRVSTAEYPMLSRTLQRVKVILKRTGEVRTVLLDEGRIVNEADINAAEEQAYLDWYGV